MSKLIGAVSVVSLTVRDLDASRHFYAETLGLGEPWFEDHAMGWVEWGKDGAKGNLAITTSREGAQPGGGTTPVLDTEDCQALVAVLRDRGVRCEDPVAVDGLLTYCTFYDLDGNRLQALSGPPAKASR